MMREKSTTVSVKMARNLPEKRYRFSLESSNPWEVYQARKERLPDDLTPEQYSKAVRAICLELGL